MAASEATSAVTDHVELCYFALASFFFFNPDRAKCFSQNKEKMFFSNKTCQKIIYGLWVFTDPFLMEFFTVGSIPSVTWFLL